MYTSEIDNLLISYMIFGKQKHPWALQPAEHTLCEWIEVRLGVIYFANKFGISFEGGVLAEKVQRPPGARGSTSSQAALFNHSHDDVE